MATVGVKGLIEHDLYMKQAGRRIGSRAASFKRPNRLRLQLFSLWGRVTPNASSPRVL